MHADEDPSPLDPIALDAATLDLDDVLSAFGLNKDDLLDLPPERNAQLHARAAVSAIFRAFDPRLPQPSNTSRFRHEFLWAMQPPAATAQERFGQLAHLIHRATNHPRMNRNLRPLLRAFQPARDSVPRLLRAFLPAQWPWLHSSHARSTIPSPQASDQEGIDLC